MKQAKYKSLGLEVRFNVPETVDEFDSNAKRVGACLDEATNNVIYRGSLAEFRDALCDKVGEAYGIDRQTKDSGRKNTDGTPIMVYDETEADYIDRVVSTKGIKREELQPLADAVASGIEFDASARERKAPKSPTIPKWALEQAKGIIASGKLDVVNGRFHKLIGKTFTATDNAEADVKTLAAMVKEFGEAYQKQGMDKLTA